MPLIRNAGKARLKKMPAVWRILEKFTAETARSISHPLLGGPTHSIGLIRGGSSANTVPDYCEVHVDRRLLPGETAKDYLMELRLRLREAGLEGVEVSLSREEPPFANSPESPLPRRLAASMQALKHAPVTSGAPWCSDASVLSKVCEDTVVWGPGSIEQAHTANEYIEASCLQTGADILRHYFLSQ
jgi:acetylornithine deacetylase